VSEESGHKVDDSLTLPPEGLSLLDLEKSVIERALSLKDGNISEAARYLHVPCHILVYRIEKHGISRPAKR
jgi:two-component system NtrC family response regulator